MYNYFHKSLPWIIVCQISYPLWQRALLKFQLCGRDNPVREESRFHFLVAFMFFRAQLKSRTLCFRKCWKNYLCDVVKMPEHAELLRLQPSFKMSPDNGNVVYDELEATGRKGCESRGEIRWLLLRKNHFCVDLCLLWHKEQICHNFTR